MEELTRDQLEQLYYAIPAEGVTLAELGLVAKPQDGNHIRAGDEVAIQMGFKGLTLSENGGRVYTMDELENGVRRKAIVDTLNGLPDEQREHINAAARRIYNHLKDHGAKVTLYSCLELVAKIGCALNGKVLP